MANKKPNRPNSNVLQLYVYDGKKTVTVKTSSNCSIADLFKSLADSCYAFKEFHPEKHLRILFTDEELLFSRKKRLSDYHIVDESTVGVIFRLPSPSLDSLKSSLCEDESEKCCLSDSISNIVDWPEQVRPELSDLTAGDITTMYGEDLDLIWRKCAKMPCGHCIGDNMLRQYCENRVGHGEVRFPCPVDEKHKDWKYPLVRQVACFTKKEIHHLEKSILDNFIGKMVTVLTCPGCSTWCSRVDLNQNWLKCFNCTAEKHRREDYIFCGSCLNEWKCGQNGQCDNPKCNSLEDKLKILENCSLISTSSRQEFEDFWFNGVFDLTIIRSIRACPKCAFLIEYNTGCTQMYCENCSHYFCFICLDGAKTKKELKCDPYYSRCSLAPVQKSIPVWNAKDARPHPE